MTIAETPATTPASAPRLSGIMPRSYMLGTACAVGTSFFLSGNNTSLAVYYEFGGTVPAMMFVRYLFYVVVVGLVCRSVSSSLYLEDGQRSGVLLIGTIYTTGMIALLTAFTLIPVSLAVLVLYTFPIVTTAIKAGLERRFPGPLFLACLGIALGGLAIALEVHDFSHNPIGIAATAWASFAFAITFVLNERWYPHIEPMAFSFHISVPGLAIVTLVYVGHLLMVNIGRPTGMEFGLPEFGSAGSYALMLSLMYYTIAILLMFRAIREISGPPTAMIMNLEPIFTLAMVTVFLGDPLRVYHLVGAGIVVAAVLGAQFAMAPNRLTRRIARVGQ